jgi:hypothetical protein
MAHDRDFRFIAIEDFADVSSYQGVAGREKLAREAELRRKMTERKIAEMAAHGQIYAPDHIIDYAENEQFWRTHFARVVRPSRSSRGAA